MDSILRLFSGTSDIDKFLDALLRNERDFIDGKTKLLLTLSSLHGALNELQRMEDSPKMKTRNKAKNLKSIVKKVSNLRLAHHDQFAQINRSSSLPYIVDVSCFEHVTTLELQRVPLHLIKGMKNLSGSVIQLKVSRSIHDMREVFPGSDESSQNGVREAWPKLKTCVLSNNYLRQLDQSASYALENDRLAYLDVSFNKLTSCEMFLQNLSVLSTLIASFNQLCVVPFFSPLAHDKMTKLVLTNNQIDSLAGLSCLYSLEYLDVRDNMLREHSALQGLSELHILKHILLSGNPLSFQPDHIPRTLLFLSPRAVHNFIMLDGRRIDQEDITNVDLLPSAESYLTQQGYALSPHPSALGFPSRRVTSVAMPDGSNTPSESSLLAVKRSPRKRAAKKDKRKRVAELGTTKSRASLLATEEPEQVPETRTGFEENDADGFLHTYSALQAEMGTEAGVKKALTSLLPTEAPALNPLTGEPITDQKHRRRNQEEAVKPQEEPKPAEPAEPDSAGLGSQLSPELLALPHAKRRANMIDATLDDKQFNPYEIPSEPERKQDDKLIESIEAFTFNADDDSHNFAPETLVSIQLRSNSVLVCRPDGKVARKMGLRQLKSVDLKKETVLSSDCTSYIDDVPKLTISTGDANETMTFLLEVEYDKVKEFVQSVQSQRKLVNSRLRCGKCANVFDRVTELKTSTVICPRCGHEFKPPPPPEDQPTDDVISFLTAQMDSGLDLTAGDVRRARSQPVDVAAGGEGRRERSSAAAGPLDVTSSCELDFSSSAGGDSGSFTSQQQHPVTLESLRNTCDVTTGYVTSVEHTLDLHLSVSVLREDEAFGGGGGLSKGWLSTSHRHNIFPGCVVLTDRSVYLFDIVPGSENMHDIDSWLRQTARFSYRHIAQIEVGVDRQSIWLKFSNRPEQFTFVPPSVQTSGRLLDAIKAQCTLAGWTQFQQGDRTARVEHKKLVKSFAPITHFAQHSFSAQFNHNYVAAVTGIDAVLCLITLTESHLVMNALNFHVSPGAKRLYSTNYMLLDARPVSDIAKLLRYRDRRNVVSVVFFLNDSVDTGFSFAGESLAAPSGEDVVWHVKLADMSQVAHLCRQLRQPWEAMWETKLVTTVLPHAPPDIAFFND